MTSCHGSWWLIRCERFCLCFRAMECHGLQTALNLTKSGRRINFSKTESRRSAGRHAQFDVDGGEEEVAIFLFFGKEVAIFSLLAASTYHIMRARRYK